MWQRDEVLLGQMRSTLEMVREASIQKTMQAAIDDKATLCGIEGELMAKMEQCLEALGAEKLESDTRKLRMAEVAASLPAVEDTAAVRAYRSAPAKLRKKRVRSSSQVAPCLRVSAAFARQLGGCAGPPRPAGGERPIGAPTRGRGRDHQERLRRRHGKEAVRRLERGQVDAVEIAPPPPPSLML